MEIKDLITYTKNIRREKPYIPIFPKICFRSFPHI